MMRRAGRKLLFPLSCLRERVDDPNAVRIVRERAFGKLSSRPLPARTFGSRHPLPQAGEGKKQAGRLRENHRSWTVTMAGGAGDSPRRPSGLGLGLFKGRTWGA